MALPTKPLPWPSRIHLAVRDRLASGRTAEHLSVADIRRIQSLEPRLTRPSRAIAPVYRVRGLGVGEFSLGGVAVRCWWPLGLSRPLPMVLMIHGGGFAFGSAARNDWLARRVARIGTLVVSPEYRLAPDFPHPCGLDDVWAAFTAAVPVVGDVSMMGDSAGGFLAALTAVRARDAGIPLRSLVPCYPATDLRLDREPPSGPRLSSGDLSRFVHMYLGGLGDDGLARGPLPVGPDVSPLAVPDLSGLPPTLIQVADHDPLERDGIAFAQRLREAGTDVTLTRYLGAAHGFYSTPRLAANATRPGIAEIAAFLGRHHLASGV